MSLDQFIRLADNIVEFQADLNDNQLPVASFSALEVHRQELKSCWNAVKLAYNSAITEAERGSDDKDDPIQVESLKVKYKSTYITYCNILMRLSELADSVQKKSDSSVRAVTQIVDNATGASTSSGIKPSISGESRNIHLPPVEIDIFSGDYTTWPTFRDIFTAIVSNSRARNVEKLFYLTQKTKGEAREIVQKCPLTNQGFDLAWSNLCLRYENRRILVNGQLKILFNLPTIHSESGKSLKQLQGDINSCISALTLYNIEVASWDPIFVYICTSKLPENTLALWEYELKDKTAIPRWANLDDFLTNRHRTLESVSEIRASNNSKQPERTKPGSSSNTQKRVHSFQTKVTGAKCQLCPKEHHAIRLCPKFLKMDHQKRLNEIKREGLCLNCFSKTHTVKSCTSRNNCFKCQKRHNTLLHQESNQQFQLFNSSGLNPNSTPFSRQNPSNIQSTRNVELSKVQSCFATNSKDVLLGTALVNICHLGMKHQVRALIDSGSEGTFISERVSNLLKLPSHLINARISGLNNSISARVHRQCSLVIGSQSNRDFEISVEALVVPQLSNNLPSQNMSSAIFSNLPDIPLADPRFYCSTKIDLLIGGDLFPSIVCGGIIHNVCQSLIAQETVFGWILTGPIANNAKPSSTIVSDFCEISLDKEISRFWEVETLPRKNILSNSDRLCEDLYKRTTERNSDGRYVVSLPFKEEFIDSPDIDSSRSSAMAQFFRNESKLVRNPQLKLDYDKVVQEYLDLGHMKKVELSSHYVSSKVYYLPHHAVVKTDSTTTKVRVVFNASAPSSNGNSLNSLLHVGPILQSDLIIIILKWRFFRFVFNADIQKMYRQILVNPCHTPYQRILFRSNPEEPISDYELRTVTFGVNCAPYLAIRTILQLKDDVESSYPIASSILRNSMYVDDVLAGAHTEQGCSKAKNELVHALSSAGFLLRKWTSNSKSLLADIPRDHLLNENFLKFEDSSSAKTLGIRWDACSDEFYFKADLFPEPMKYTKREVLSRIAKLFDPAGWLAPCIIQAKILMQKIWVDGTDWDEVLVADMLNQWKSFEANYPYVNSIRIPRWIDYRLNADIQFHGFCDASKKAYAAALYVRIEYDGSSPHT